MKRSLIFLGIILFISIAIFGLYQYNKPHRDIASSTADYELSGDDLCSEFARDVEVASEKYADKVVTFSGVISSIQQNQNGNYNILLEGQAGSINCEIDQAIKINTQNLSENTRVKIKGLCVGYDDLLQELQFKKCNIVQ